MSGLKEVATKAMQAMISSKYITDFIVDGRAGASSIEVSGYDAIAAESVKYAEALIKQLEEKGDK